jgi:REP element-mobilizing transposase RayT
MCNPEKHHRRSIRLKGYDYSQAGAYFVTVCVKNKENSLGKIIDGEMFLSEIGKIAEKCWNEIPIHYPHVQLDKYIIMPNHIHGILKIIDNDYVWVENEGVKNVGAEDFQPLRPHTQKNINMGIENFQPLHQPQSKINQYQKIIPKSLGSIVRGFKIGVTKWCNHQKYKHFAFQRNYHEHIDRNENELNRIREHIINNPLQWQFDRENPDRIVVAGKNVGAENLQPLHDEYIRFEEIIYGKK